MYFHVPCGVVLYFVVCKLYTDKEKKSGEMTLTKPPEESYRIT